MRLRSIVRGRTWAWYLFAGAVGGAAYLWAPRIGKNGIFFSALSVTSVVAIVAGVRSHRPRARLAWYLLALGQLLFVIGDALAYNYTRIFGSEIPFPSIADVFYLAVYPSLIAGLLLLIRRRNPGGDRSSLLDAMIITLGAGLVSWVYLMAPIARATDVPVLVKLTALAYPLMDLALLAVLVRLAVGSGARVLSYRLLVFGAGALLVADAIYGWINLHGSYPGGTPLDLVWLAFYFLWGAAALHPSMRELERPVEAEPARHVRRRLAILAGASLLGPMVELIQSLSGQPLEAGVVSACTAAMFVLVLLRLDGAMVDVHQYRQAERTARAAERKYRSLVEDLPAVVYVSDPRREGAWQYVSPKIREVLGYAPEEFERDPSLWERSLHSEDRDRTLREEAEAIAEGRRIRSEYRISARDGRFVWIREEADTIADEDGGGTLLQGVMYDITDVKLAEETLVRALEAEREAAANLRALDEMKTSFLQAISHDLRTPLTSILGSALTLERADLELSPEDTRDLAGRIAANARRLNRLLTNLLDLDRISRGIVEPNRRSTDMRVVAQTALEGVESRRLRLDIAPIRADVDAAQVERILENLVLNAIRFAPGDSPIDVRIGPEDDGVLIQVDDRGPGVPHEIRGGIFEPFNQGTATLAHAPGVGIGLSLVARFAQLHDGRAWVDDRPGGGSSFRVWLDARTEPAHGRFDPAALHGSSLSRAPLPASAAPRPPHAAA